jgi:transcriptional regulator
MYDIPYFKADHPEEVLSFMKAHPFALICGADGNGLPVATQIPFLFEQRGDQLFLQGHVMKKQDHTRAFYQNPHVLIVFTGAHSYVSASWYEHQQVASTWNYQSVQAAGKIQFRDEAFLLQLLTRLTERFESPGSPALVQEMDPAYVEQMMQAIVGFEVEVHSIRHVFKLSQNRDEKSRANIISRLGEQEGVAREMGRIMKEKYKRDS